MLRRFSRRRRTIDQALVVVWIRPDAIYAMRHVQTTSGVWLLEGSPAVVLPLNVEPALLGEAILKLARPVTRRVRHPKQSEWESDTAHREAAVFRQAGVDSWPAFERNAKQVAVERDGDTATATPLVRNANLRGAWSEDTVRTVRLDFSNVLAVGRAIFEVLA